MQSMEEEHGAATEPSTAVNSRDASLDNPAKAPKAQ